MSLHQAAWPPLQPYPSAPQNPEITMRGLGCSPSPQEPLSIEQHPHFHMHPSAPGNLARTAETPCLRGLGGDWRGVPAVGSRWFQSPHSVPKDEGLLCHLRGVRTRHPKNCSSWRGEPRTEHFSGSHPGTGSSSLRQSPAHPRTALPLHMWGAGKCSRFFGVVMIEPRAQRGASEVRLSETLDKFPRHPQLHPTCLRQPELCSTLTGRISGVDPA